MVPTCIRLLEGHPPGTDSITFMASENPRMDYIRFKKRRAGLQPIHPVAIAHAIVDYSLDLVHINPEA